MADKEKTPAGDKEKGRTTDWMEVLKVVAMPVVVTVIGLVINSSLSERQIKETNIRLYADMMARREQADSELRKSMFTDILNKVTAEVLERKSADHLDQQIVNLELMAYNFSESIDLAPLFQHLRRQIPEIPEGAALAESKRFEHLRKRLERVAGDVVDRQLSIVSDTGVAVVTPVSNLDQISQAPAKIMFSGRSAVPTKGAKSDDAVNQVCLGLYTPDEEKVNYRRFRLEVVDLDPASRELQIRLYVSVPLTDKECRAVDFDMNRNAEVETLFWVGMFDFPMIDNARLTHSERCSVSISELAPDHARLALAYFPSSRSSLKDKPFYDDLQHDLLHKESKRPTKTSS